MFKKHRDRTATSQNDAINPDSDNAGFTGLEGDFEAERRRAAVATHERVRPYEHGEGENPVLPSTTAGLTHP